MDKNKLRPAQGGTSTEATRWRTAEYRQRIVKKIMYLLVEHVHRTSALDPSEVKKIAGRLEEKANTAAKDETDYHAKIASNIRTLVASYKSSDPKVLHSNSSSRGEASSAAGTILPLGVEASAANGDWQEETYQRVQRIKSTRSTILNEIYQYFCTKQASYLLNLTPTTQPLLTTKLEKCKKMKKLLEEIFMHLNVTKTQITPSFKEKLDSVEKLIQKFLDDIAMNARGKQPPNLQPKQQLDSSQSRIPQGESSEMKPNLQGMNLQGSPLRMQNPQQNMMHLQGQSAKLALEQEKSDKLMHQVARESISSKIQQNQLPSMKGDTSKHPLENFSSSSCGTIIQQETSKHAQVANDSPGISPSLLLENCCNLNEISGNFSGDAGKHPLEKISAPSLLQDICDPNKVSQSSTVSCDNLSPAMKRLVRALTNVSSKALDASVNEIRAVVSLNDRIAVSAPVIGSKGAIGEDLGADTNARFRESRYYTDHDLVPNRRKRCKAMPSITSQVKRTRIEQKCALLEEEIREINKQLIDVEVEMCEKETSTIATGGAVEHGDGFVVKCFFRSSTVNWNLMPPIMIKPLQLLIPTNYPACSPIFLDEMPVEVSKDVEDFSMKARSKLSFSLQNPMLPLSLRYIATLWESCAREVITEYATQHGGGTFSSKY